MYPSSELSPGSPAYSFPAPAPAPGHALSCPSPEYYPPTTELATPTKVPSSPEMVSPQL